MQKEFKLQNISVGSTLAWQIVTYSSKTITVGLKSDARFYFSEAVCKNTLQIPNAQGADICGDSNLTLTLSCDSDFSITSMSYELLSESGDKIGYAYHYNGYVAENQSEKMHIVISVWNDSISGTAGEEFIAECFYKYLSLKNKYLFNYISDKAIADYTAELDKLSGENKYKKWYDDKMKDVTSEFMQYKLIFALLLNYDNNYNKDVKNTGISYSVNKNLVMAFGKKQWNETKLTIGSCPFQNIRGIVLNSAELEKFNALRPILSETTMFAEGKLSVAASHASEASKLAVEATRGLNFANIGLNVFSWSGDEQQSVNEQKRIIEKSIMYAVSQKASILIFPELAINENILNYLEECLISKGTSLKLAVGGSHYKNSSPPFNNLSPIYANISGQWQRITDYAKMIPFSMGYTQNAAKAFGIDTDTYRLNQYKLLTEDIHMDDNIMLLPYKDCVVGVAICRDAMDLLDSHNPLHKYCDFVDVMLVISDNSGDSNMFVGTAECLARWHNCATVYTNSLADGHPSSGGDPYLEISFALYPYKGTDVSSSTSVSGEIDYAKKPFGSMTVDGGMVSILYSKGIKYTTFTDDEIANCCKVYTIETAK